MLTISDFISDHLDKLKHGDLISDYYHKFGLNENIIYNSRLFYNNIDIFFNEDDTYDKYSNESTYKWRYSIDSSIYSNVDSNRYSNESIRLSRYRTSSTDLSKYDSSHDEDEEEDIDPSVYWDGDYFYGK